MAEAAFAAGDYKQAEDALALANELEDPAIKPQFVSRNVGTDPKSGKPLVQQHWVRGVLPNGELDLVPIEQPGVKGALTEVNINSGQSPTDAAKTELLAQGILDMKEYKNLLINPDGSVNRTLVAQLNVPGFAGVPGTKSRDAFSLLHNAVEAKLRAESGAAVPETEVKRIAERFFPSVLDNDETIINKQRRLNAFLEGTFRRIKGKQQIIDSEGNIYEFDNRSRPTEIQEIDDELEAIERELNG